MHSFTHSCIHSTSRPLAPPRTLERAPGCCQAGRARAYRTYSYPNEHQQNVATADEGALREVDNVVFWRPIVEQREARVQHASRGAEVHEQGVGAHPHAAVLQARVWVLHATAPRRCARGARLGALSRAQVSAGVCVCAVGSRDRPRAPPPGGGEASACPRAARRFLSHSYIYVRRRCRRCALGAASAPRGGKARGRKGAPRLRPAPWSARPAPAGACRAAARAGSAASPLGSLPPARAMLKTEQQQASNNGGVGGDADKEVQWRDLARKQELTEVVEFVPRCAPADPCGARLPARRLARPRAPRGAAFQFCDTAAHVRAPGGAVSRASARGKGERPLQPARKQANSPLLILAPGRATRMHSAPLISRLRATTIRTPSGGRAARHSWTSSHTPKRSHSKPFAGTVAFPRAREGYARGEPQLGAAGNGWGGRLAARRVAARPRGPPLFLSQRVWAP